MDACMRNESRVAAIVLVTGHVIVDGIILVAEGPV